MADKKQIIIIGSGLGGLLCGVILSRKGYKVTVLEKNHQIGGSLQSFSRNGCDFSTGLHYVGSLDKGQTLYKVFNYFNLFDGIEYKRLNEDGFDIFSIANKEYRFPIGWKSFKNQMIKYFPDEKTAIENYVNEIQKTIGSQDIYRLDTKPINHADSTDYLKLNTCDFINSLTKNRELRQVLAAFNFVYAGDAAKSPFYVHALINNHFISSSYRIVGRTSQISDKLTEQITNSGGLVLKNKKVVTTEFEGNCVKRVVTSDGEKFNADYVISNMHPATTMNIIPEDMLRRSFRARLKRKPNTISAFAVHIVLKENTFKYRNYNYNYYKNDSVWYASDYNEKKWPEHYFLHSKVPSNNQTYTNCIGLLTHMKFEEVEKWKDLPINNRGEEYKKFKNTKAQQLIDLASINFPELKNNIKAFYVSTPLTYYDYLGTPNGSMYGTLRDCNNPVGSYISPRTKIDNLLFTGQNLNLHGILGVSLSSIITCGELIGTKNIIKEINSNG